MFKSAKYEQNKESAWAKEVGDIIRKARKENNLTIRGMAKAAMLSPTHLNRMENGERPLDSVWDMVHISQVCGVPIEDFLVKFDYDMPVEEAPIRRAFPGVKTKAQEDAIASFAKLVTSRQLSGEELTQVLDSATAYADFCEKKRR